MAKLYGKSLRSDSHPIGVLIACSSPDTDEKLRSKWSLALQFAYSNRVAPANLWSFMLRPGGMAGCAAEFAKLNKKRKQQRASKAKQQQKIASKKKQQQKASSKKTVAKPEDKQRDDQRRGNRTSW
jgi:hypothetical protein